VVATEVMLIAVCVLATEFLHKAKQAKDVAIEDLRDAISFLRVAAQRFTNLATMHLGVPVHFMKVNRAGIIYKAYANDGVELPSDGSGSVEGQRVCPFWTTRPVFAQPDWSQRPRLSRPVGPAPNSANACAIETTTSARSRWRRLTCSRLPATKTDPSPGMW
jgi:predicted transcriptional regulator